MVLHSLVFQLLLLVLRLLVLGQELGLVRGELGLPVAHRARRRGPPILQLLAHLPPQPWEQGHRLQHLQHLRLQSQRLQGHLSQGQGKELG